MTAPFDPLGLRRQFDAELDRLEAAIEKDTIGYVGYGPLEYQVMMAVAEQFVESDVWDSLSYPEQKAYQDRLAFLKLRSKGLQL